MKKIVLLLLILVTLQASGKAVRINGAIFGSQRRIFRGALIWDAPIIGAGPSFVFFDTVALGGPGGGLSIFKQLNESHKISTGLRAFDDGEPNGPFLILKEREEDFKNQRQTTNEVFLRHDYRYKFFFTNSFTFFQDIKRHKGRYIYNRSKINFLPLLGFQVGLGVGDTAHNRYVYGPSANGGLGHVDLGLSALLPFLPWDGKLIINIMNSTITQKENYSADYIRGNNNNINTSILAVWNLY